MKPHGGPTESVFNVNLKPVIAEIARTQVCFPDIQLLVDKIVIQTLPNPETPTGAFRLQLTDGENVIHGRYPPLHVSYHFLYCSSSSQATSL